MSFLSIIRICIFAFENFDYEMISINPRKQSIGDINNSNVIAVNGDVVINVTMVENIQESFLDTIRKDTEMFSLKAIEAAKDKVKTFATLILAELCNAYEWEALIDKFSDISLQATIHDATLGYITNEDNKVKQLIIDVFIDRIKLKNTDSKALILNRVISILPQLNQNSLSLIALMTLRHMISPLHPMLDDYWQRLSPIIDTLPDVKNIDIDYLRGSGCTDDITGLYPIETFENHLLKQYDLYFRKRIPYDEWDIYCSKNPAIRNVVNEWGTCMFYFADSSFKEVRFLDSNSTVFYQRLKERNQTELIPLIEKLKSKYPLFSPQEVRTHMCSFNKNWDMAFEILNTSLVRIGVNTCGLYIGSRLINRLEGGKGCSLEDMYNKISL